LGFLVEKKMAVIEEVFSKQHSSWIVVLTPYVEKPTMHSERAFLRALILAFSRAPRVRRSDSEQVIVNVA